MASPTDSFDDLGLRRLDEDECWRFLERHSLGRVGLVHLDNPMVFPVNYVLDGHSVVFRTAPGTKLALAAVGVQAVFEVDEATEALESGTSVMVHGSMHEVTGAEDIERLERLPLRTWAREGRDRFVRIEAGWVSGRELPVRPSGDGLGADAG